MQCWPMPFDAPTPITTRTCARERRPAVAVHARFPFRSLCCFTFNLCATDFRPSLAYSFPHLGNFYSLSVNASGWSYATEADAENFFTEGIFKKAPDCCEFLALIAMNEALTRESASRQWRGLASLLISAHFPAEWRYFHWQSICKICWLRSGQKQRYHRWKRWVCSSKFDHTLHHILDSNAIVCFANWK